MTPPSPSPRPWAFQQSPGIVATAPRKFTSSNIPLPPSLPLHIMGCSEPTKVDAVREADMTASASYGMRDLSAVSYRCCCRTRTSLGRGTRSGDAPMPALPLQSNPRRGAPAFSVLCIQPARSEGSEMNECGRDGKGTRRVHRGLCLRWRHCERTAEARLPELTTFCCVLPACHPVLILLGVNGSPPHLSRYRVRCASAPLQLGTRRSASVGCRHPPVTLCIAVQQFTESASVYLGGSRRRCCRHSPPFIYGSPLMSITTSSGARSHSAGVA